MHAAIGIAVAIFVIAAFAVGVYIGVGDRCEEDPDAAWEFEHAFDVVQRRCFQIQDPELRDFYLDELSNAPTLERVLEVESAVVARLRREHDARMVTT
jgi:hypothetical protein